MESLGPTIARRCETTGNVILPKRVAKDWQADIIYAGLQRHDHGGHIVCLQTRLDLDLFQENYTNKLEQLLLRQGTHPPNARAIAEVVAESRRNSLPEFNEYPTRKLDNGTRLVEISKLCDEIKLPQYFSCIGLYADKTWSGVKNSWEFMSRKIFAKLDKSYHLDESERPRALWTGV